MVKEIRIKGDPWVLWKAVHWYRQEIQLELRQEVEDSTFWRKGDPEKVELHDQLMEMEFQLGDMIRID